jgi:hypothetical protein
LAPRGQRRGQALALRHREGVLDAQRAGDRSSWAARSPPARRR